MGTRSRARYLFLSTYGRLLTGLLALLGFSLAGCEIADEYGTPYATYEFKGSVRNEAGQPVPDIQVERRNSFSEAAYPLTRTDAEGNFAGSFQDMPHDKWILRFTDVDGPAHGSLATDSVEVGVDNNDYKKGKGSWSRGTARKEVPTIILKEKK